MQRVRVSGGHRKRRALLSGAASAIVAGFAGCLGALDGSDPNPTGDPGDDGDALRPSLPESASYRQHQYGPAHAGDAPGSGPTDDVEAAWSFREGPDDPAYEIGSPAIVDGTVYVAEGRSDEKADAATVVYALDGATGEIEWEQEFSGTNALGTTAVVDDVVVQVISGQIAALEADSGTERWRVGRDLASVATVADGTVYAIETTYADPPTLIAFSLENGRERWSVPLANGDRFWPTAPAVVDGIVYLGGTELVALSADTGERRWARSFETTVTGAPTVVDDALYVPLGDGTVRAFELDGSRRWKRAVEQAGHGTGMEFVTSPAVADGTCYVVSSWQLTAIDAGDGSIRWTTETGADGAPVVADGVVYVGGLTAMVAHDAATGDRLWRHGSSASNGAGPVAPVVGDAVFYPSGGLHALIDPDAST